MATDKSLLGTTAMAAASSLRVGLQVLIIPVIGRLLGPNAYGEIALVSPFVFFALMIAESGFGACIVRAPEVTQELQGTILVFSGGISSAVIILFALICYPLGKIVHEATFPGLLMGMSSILIFAALSIVPTALLIRAKRYDIVALSDVASSVGSIMGVALGISLGWGVWSLVSQQIGLWLGKVAVIIWATRWVPVFTFSRQILQSQLSFGSRLTGNAILSFVARNVDNILIGMFMGSETLGYYALAYQIVGLPAMILSGSVYFTMMSKSSEAQRSGEVRPDFFLRVLRVILLVGMPTIVGLALTAPVSIPLLLGDKWTSTVRLVVLLAPLGLQQMITALTGGAIIGLGRSDVMLRLGLTSSSLTIFAIFIGAYFGSDIVAAGVSITALLTTLLHIKAVSKFLHSEMLTIFRTATAPVASSFIMAVSTLAVGHFIPVGWPLLDRLLTTIVVGVCAYSSSLLIGFHEDLAADFRLLRTQIFAPRK